LTPGTRIPAALVDPVLALPLLPLDSNAKDVLLEKVFLLPGFAISGVFCSHKKIKNFIADIVNCHNLSEQPHF
jgi:hypothetical protein